MVGGLLASSADTRGNKSNSHAKFAITPHQRSMVLVETPYPTIPSGVGEN
jgi:hypothetical protein